MARGSDSLQPLGICHRFFNFILNTLIGQGMKRVTLGRDAAHHVVVSPESVEVPIEDSSRNHRVKRSSKSNGEVVIEFRHIDQESGNGLTHVVDHDRTLAPKGDAEPAREESKQSKSTPNGDAGIQGNYKGPGEIKRASVNRENGPKKMVPLAPKESAGKREKEDAKDIVIHQPTSSGNESEDSKVSMPQRPFKPLLMRTATNINEKADAYIRSRKEAMRQALQP